jgi:alpha-galactosidase
MRMMTAGGRTFRLSGDTGTFRVSLTATREQAGIDLVHLTMEAEAALSPPSLTLTWLQSAIDIHGFWRPSWSPRQDLWDGFVAKGTSWAPVASLFNLNGHNRHTFALSDALNPVRIEVGLHEETASYYCSITFFFEPSAPRRTYAATLRLDTRCIPYHLALRDIQAWWAALPGCQPAPVPEAARLPMYSTWYSFHQSLDAAEIERQCRLAKALGCEAVIVDDGWQTADHERGYAYCGDWQVYPEKFPDMQAHVAAIHALGMKYILWYAVPFVGPHTMAWSRFKDKLLRCQPVGPFPFDIGVLDPRFPEVRSFLIQTYVEALRAWDLDGFKLDFVDEFVAAAGQAPDGGQGRDYVSVPEAVDRLLTDIIESLRVLKPDIMIEFRQTYIGPMMRKYGNMFRAADCPAAAPVNRVRTLDVRLLCGETAAHADMFLWRADEPVESAAQQFISTLFAVPQISVLLDRLPPDHQDMVRFWLGFWRDNRDVLLEGDLVPLHPEMNYPIVTASTATKRVMAMYQRISLSPGADVPSQLIIVNGTYGEKIVLDLIEDLGWRRLVVRNCRGHIVRDEIVPFKAGLYDIAVPPASVISLSIVPEG